MSTIDSKPIILTILLNNGVYPGDPQLAQVWQYTSSYGGWCGKIYLRPDHLDPSPYVHNPELLWTRELGLTPAGEKFIAECKEAGITPLLT